MKTVVWLRNPAVACFVKTVGSGCFRHFIMIQLSERAVCSKSLLWMNFWLWNIAKHNMADSLCLLPHSIWQGYGFLTEKLLSSNVFNNFIIIFTIIFTLSFTHKLTHWHCRITAQIYLCGKHETLREEKLEVKLLDFIIEQPFIHLHNLPAGLEE